MSDGEGVFIIEGRPVKWRTNMFGGVTILYDGYEDLIVPGNPDEERAALYLRAYRIGLTTGIARGRQEMQFEIKRLLGI